MRLVLVLRTKARRHTSASRPGVTVTDGSMSVKTHRHGDAIMSLTWAHDCLYIDPTNFYDVEENRDRRSFDRTLSNFIERQCSVDCQRGNRD